MAKVFGKSGRYVAEEAVNQRLRLVLLACLVIGTLGLILGLTLAPFIPTGWMPIWLRIILFFLSLGLILGIYKWTDRRFNELEKRRVNMQRGLSGESLVAEKLANFPDEFCVINDLTTLHGNIDHVVVGPTGVFILDSKNWRGVVTSDGNGELLLNGQTTDKPFIRQYGGRVMGIRDKVRALTSEVDPFYQAVFIFTSARVQAKWGTTRSVHCITDDQLQDYIVHKEFGKRLKPQEVQAIAQAFLGLAHMDREFAQTATLHNAPASATRLGYKTQNA